MLDRGVPRNKLLTMARAGFITLLMNATQTKLTPAKLLNAALAKVESKSIREWATSAHNRPIWLKIAKAYTNRPDPVLALTTDIMATAIGL